MLTVDCWLLNCWLLSWTLNWMWMLNVHTDIWHLMFCFGSVYIRLLLLFWCFVLAAAAPLLFFSLLSQSFALLLVASWTPMRSLTLRVAILHRAAALAFSKCMSTGLWCVARRTTNGGRSSCCRCGCSCCCWFTFLFVQYFKTFNSFFVSFVCCFGPPFTC